MSEGGREMSKNDLKQKLQERYKFGINLVHFIYKKKPSRKLE